jgi:uroporphyrinogen decarboxylase
MTTEQWKDLLDLIDGHSPARPPVGFIIDSPWLPGWNGIPTMDYYSSDERWFKANLRAIREFPDATFLPGFWVEYGELNEPSAFGTRLDWAGENMPHAWPVIHAPEKMTGLIKPNVRTDGLLPLMINRLKIMEPRIREEGHEIRFAVSRGPFNIASFLMGATEFMLAMMTHPEETRQLLQTITEFTVEWLSYQKECFPTIDGIMILDDLIGFVGEPECTDFAVPFLKEIYGAFRAKVNFFHNDSDGLVIGNHLAGIGVNLYNFSFKHSMHDMRTACGESVVLLGNIPPRDVLASGTAEAVREAVRKSYTSIENKQRIMWSGGGGVPQGVPTENIRAFIETIHDCYS